MEVTAAAATQIVTVAATASTAVTVVQLRRLMLLKLSEALTGKTVNLTAGSVELLQFSAVDSTARSCEISRSA